ncbi:MAG: formimidoylglutamase [Bacteroidales bacterium]|nr:formimidoylglutamase [Bacteroidales bacterium]
MINLNDYLDPVSIERPEWLHIAGSSTLAHNLSINTASNPVTSADNFRLAIIGVPDDRLSVREGAAKAPDAIRTTLYNLSRLPGKVKIADLGNIRRGVTPEDTMAALGDVITTLLDKGVMVLVLGGDSSLIPSLATPVAALYPEYTYTTIDSRIDYVNEKRENNPFNYLSGIINSRNHQPSNIIHIGYQSYLNDPQVINRFRRRNYELLRIGEARSSMHETEPFFRDSHLITLDMGAVRQSDAPGTFAPSPNGFYGEEICLLARYAGLSDSLKVFGLFELNPDLDIRSQTAAMAAHITWFFLEGFVQRHNESETIATDRNGRFVRYHVAVDKAGEDLIFVKSSTTGRWWIEYRDREGRVSYLACSYNDYLKAGDNEIPNRWLQAVARKG